MARTVWDGDGDSEVFEYPDLGPGDACVLDTRVWHQSNPITSGERWVVVIFYQVLTSTPGGAPAPAPEVERRKEVRSLLARRVTEAAGRKEKQSGRRDASAWHEGAEGREEAAGA